MLKLVNEITNHRDNNEKRIVILIDFAKAFDIVSYDILFVILSRIGVRGTVLNDFKSYFAYRCQFVKIGTFFSNPQAVKMGFFGQILFNLYINRLF